MSIAYSYCVGLSRAEKTTIDIQVCKNREKVSIFVKNLPSNAKNKTKKVILVCLVGDAVWFYNPPPDHSMGPSLPIRS